MTDESVDTTIEAHKKFAVELFGHAWGLYDKQGRTPDEDDEMVNAAHASAHHWQQLKGQIDETRWLQSTPRSHNQLANVYIALTQGERALYHAKRCVELCKARGIGDFDLAFGYECLAKAFNVVGDVEKRNACLKLALEAVGDIEKEEDKKYFMSELEKAPGYAEVK